MTHKINPFQKLFEGAIFASVSSFLFISTALAGPNGGHIEAGSGSINGQGTNAVIINQHSGRIVINWKNFDTQVGESVEFRQPNANALAVNRIKSGKPTEILGSLRANGEVIVINPNGVVIGTNAHVDVNKLVLTTADIATKHAMQDKQLTFDKAGNKDAKIINNGAITAGQAGLVGFVGPQVVNNGTINVKIGKAQLASGSTFTLDLAGDDLVNIAVSKDVVKQLAINSGTIKGDYIEVSAAGARNVIDKMVVNTGVIEAQGASQRGGTIILGGDDAQVAQTGVLNASGKSGGTIQVKAEKALLNGAMVAMGSAGKGGDIDVTASESMIIGKDNLMDVYGSEAGHIDLESSWLASAGTYLAQSYSAIGGDIRLLGDNLYFAPETFIDASGLYGGGHVYIGGDFQGKGELHTASTTYIDQDALIVNDAVLEGDGGQTIVWSNNATDFFGTILARGVGQGSGGFTEVSGKDHLNFQGNVDLTSESGKKGTLLLDPAAISVYGNVDPLFVSTDGTVNLSTNLKLWLDASAASTVTLNYSVSGLGTTATGVIGTNTITTAANVSANLAVGARIRLNAAGVITTADTMGPDTYTIAAISGTTITTVEALSQNYSGVALYRGLVSQWTDRSGANINATQASVTNQPLWISSTVGLNNGVGAIQFFNAAKSYLDLTVDLDNSAGATNSIFFDMNWTGSGNQMPLGFTTYDLWFATATNFGYNTGASNVYGVNATTAGLANSWHQVQADFYNGVNSNNKIYLDNTNQTLSVQQGGVGTQNISDAMRISSWRNDTNYTFNGRIGEIIAYNTAISGIKRDLIMQYQTSKTGIALNAPGTGATENAKATSATGYDVFTTDYLEYLSKTADVNLLATNAITLDLQGATLNLANDRSISFATTSGSINSVSAGTIQTTRTGSGGNISFTAGGTGNVNISDLTLRAQGGGTINVTAGGAATLGVLNGGTINATSGTAKDITLNGALTATASGNSVVLNSGRNFINSGGSIDPGAGRFLIYSADPANNALGGITVPTKRYNKTFVSYAPGSVAEAGNVFLYSIAPVITVTADDASRLYGAADPTFTASYGGYIDGDTSATAFSGSPDLTPGATVTSDVGAYAITPSMDTLLSTLGYGFTFVDGTLTISPAALIVTADNKTKVSGQLNPLFTLNFSGLVNGDLESVFSGSLVTSLATAASPAGLYAINVAGGTAANYTVTRVDGQLTVDPAPDVQPDLPFKQLWTPEIQSNDQQSAPVNQETKVANVQSTCLYKIVNFDGSISAGSCGSSGK